MNGVNMNEPEITAAQAKSISDSAAITMAKLEKSDCIKELEIDGYKFTVNTDLLDDVEAFENIDRIENKGQVAAIVPLLHFLIGKEGYEDMKAHFVKVDGKFRITKLSKVYEIIIENFNPKG